MQTATSDPTPSDQGAEPRDSGALGWRRVLGLLGIVGLLDVAVAAVLTLAASQPGSLVRYLVFSQSIGLSITAWILLIRYVLPGLKRRGAQVNVALSMIVAAPLGYASGYALAALLLGETIRIDGLDQARRLGVIATLLAAVGFTVLFWLRQRLLAERVARSEAQRLASDAQLRLLRAQLEPHMLFNTLANLRALVDEDPLLAQRMIDQLITYLRSALAASRSESTTLQHEFTQLRAYLEIMALRMGPRMSYRLLLPEALQDVSIPPMLLQPLVENAIRHGIEPKVGSGAVEVQARLDGEGVEIAVTDSGLGLPPDEDAAASGGGSYGLVHVRERLQAVYGSAASLSLRRVEPQGVCATVRIPR